MYVSTVTDDGRATVFDHRALTVAAASPRHLLAMKLLAARASDADDIGLLLEVLGIGDVDAAVAIVQEVFPGTSLTDRGLLLLEDLLGG